jgi:hypothetical protein
MPLSRRAFLSTASAIAAAQSAKPRPNVVVLYADDMS